MGVPELLPELARRGREWRGEAESLVPSRLGKLTPSLWMEEPFMRQGRSTA